MSAGANAMAMSLACGERVTLSKVDAFADGVAVKQVRLLTTSKGLFLKSASHDL